MTWMGLAPGNVVVGLFIVAKSAAESADVTQSATLVGTDLATLGLHIVPDCITDVLLVEGCRPGVLQSTNTFPPWTYGMVPRWQPCADGWSATYAP